jgi:ABC-type lipoprotein export system ATPase subunit
VDGHGLIELRAVSKAYGGVRPLKVKDLRLGATDRVVLGGLDRAAAEMFVHLVTGAALPDAGTLRVDGRDTRDIVTDAEWLSSLDCFGIVTMRAVLVSALSIAQNLALPLTLSVDRLTEDVRTAIETLADEVGLTSSRLVEPASDLSPDEVVRVHLARALALRPRMLLLEHPTSAVEDPEARQDLGRRLAAVADRRQVGWLAVTDDDDFAATSGARRLRLKPSGHLASGDSWWGRRLRRPR